MDNTARGPYAKGIERRRQILEQALAAYGESDATGPSLRSIASRVGLSERGLLHYFSSRDELLVAILRERDQQDRALFDPEGSIDQLSVVTERASRTPGLVRLYAELAGAAADTAHAAHDYFVVRYRDLRALLERMVRQDIQIGERPGRPEVGPEFVARMLIAASDGLQQQWLLDPSIDLESDLRTLARLLEADSSAE